MSFQQKFIQSLVTLAVTGVLVGCSGGSSDTEGKTATSFTTPTVATQSIQSDDAVETFCTGANADPDGDGWGWENGQSCEAAGNTDVQNEVDNNRESEATTPVASGDDLPVGIVYYLWHCAPTAAQHNNITQILNGQADWGNISTFHWWDQPDAGYYCLGDRPDLITRHLTQLRDAGINYLVIDITNHPNTASLDAENLILRSLRPLLEIARTIPNAPKIVPWVPFTNDHPGTRNERANVCNNNGSSAACQTLQQAQPMYQHVTDLLINQYPELTFEYNGKPLLLEAANYATYSRTETDTVRAQLASNWSVQRLWGLGLTNNEWQFLTTCENPSNFFESNGWAPEGCNQPVNAGEQISVSAAYQYTYISDPLEKNAQAHAGYTGGMPKFYGRTMAQQFRVAFENRDSQPMVLLTGWNEWIAQRFEVNGRVTFVDSYDDTLNRDIEPGGASGDLYYYLMRDLITEYRNNKPFAFEDYFLTANSILDTDYYWNAYADLQSVFDKDDKIGLNNHWLTVGMQEGRRPSVAFDVNYYSNNYPDLANTGITTPAALLNHFIDSGFQEGRRGSADFHAKAYLGRYPQLATAFGNNGFYKSFKHYVTAGQTVNHNAKP